MDSTSLTAVIAIACLAIGALGCWLLMRGHAQAASSPSLAQSRSHPGLQGELGKAKAQALELEAQRNTAVANCEKSEQQAAQLGQALELARQEQARAVEKAAQVPGLELRLRALQDHQKASQPDAQAKSKIQNELADAKKRQRVLEDERQSAIANCEKANLQARQLREALELAQNEQAQLAGQAAQLPALQARLLALQQENQQQQAGQHALQRQLAACGIEQTEALKLAAGRLAELQLENAALKEDAATVAALLAEQKEAPPAITPASAPTGPTQLPVLEREVVALQSLAKTIQQEFELFAEMQRTFTLTSTTVQDFSDEPAAQETASAAT
ncbi:MAG: tolA protein [Polaromonas sp.]|nr:tolA protein [Polaromonas sp.]